MRFLSANDIFQQSAIDSYKPQQLAMIFGTGSPPGDMIKHL